MVTAAESEQLLVLGQVEAEQREGLGEGPPAQHHLGAPAGERVDRGEPLEDPDRVVRAEHRDGRAEPDPLRAGRHARQHDVGGAHREVGAVVLPHPDEVHPHLVGQDGLLHDITQDLRVVDGPTAAVDGDVAEGVETEGDILGGGVTVGGVVGGGRRRRGGRRRGVVCGGV